MTMMAGRKIGRNVESRPPAHEGATRVATLKMAAIRRLSGLSHNPTQCSRVAGNQASSGKNGNAGSKGADLFHPCDIHKAFHCLRLTQRPLSRIAAIGLVPPTAAIATYCGLTGTPRRGRFGIPTSRMPE